MKRLPRRLGYGEEATLGEHLEELRRRLFIIIGAVVLAAIVAFVFHNHVLDFLNNPLPSDRRRVTTLTVTEPFTVSITVSLYAGVAVAMPIILWQLWAFLAPAFDPSSERRIVVLVALASGLGAVIAPILAVAIATQVSAKVLDGGIETPAEKLTQTLLPTIVRGRIGGFLDGTAKRAGAVLGGIVAALLVGTPTAFYVVTAVAAALWLLSATRIARELPALAVEHAADSHAVATTGRAAASGWGAASAAADAAKVTGRIAINARTPSRKRRRGGPASTSARCSDSEKPSGSGSPPARRKRPTVASSSASAWPHAAHDAACARTSSARAPSSSPPATSVSSGRTSAQVMACPPRAAGTARPSTHNARA